MGDELLLAGTSRGLAKVPDALVSPASIEYVATGRQVPATWLWRTLSARSNR
ncbi:MAG: hypothetical protein LCH66_12620 [Actinobacteria bacterium]|nr:hypothetical protein [Actinomycetota bacterium]